MRRSQSKAAGLRPAQRAMFSKRLAEAQALLYGNARGPAQPLIDQWLADVTRGWAKPPQMTLPLEPCR